MITLYDIGPTTIDKSMGLSPFVRTIRFALNYKKIPYSVVDVSLIGLDSVAQSLGAPPTMNYLDGSPKYTVPIIHDSTTGKVVSDSFKIAEYLDETYPDTPRIIPAGTRMLQLAFCNSAAMSFVPLLPIIRPATAADFFPAEIKEEMRETFGEGAVKVLLTPEEQAEAWRTALQGYRLIAQGYEGRTPDDSSFVMGGTEPTYADMFMTGFLWWIKLVFSDTQGWKDIIALGDGKIGRLVEETLAICAKKAL